MELAGYTSLAIAIIILMLKPGPYMFTYITLSLEGRWRTILSFFAGYISIRTISYYFFLTSLTLLPIGFGMIFIFIKAIAAILFVSLGLQGLANVGAENKPSLDDADGIKKNLKSGKFLQNFVTGGVLHLSNPYDYVFILTVIPALMGTTEFSLADITYINFMVIGLDILVNGAYILPILYFRKFLPMRVMNKIKYITSTFMILIGLYVFATIFFRSGLEESQLLSMITMGQDA